MPKPKKTKRDKQQIAWEKVHNSAVFRQILEDLYCRRGLSGLRRAFNAGWHARGKK